MLADTRPPLLPGGKLSDLVGADALDDADRRQHSAHGAHRIGDPAALTDGFSASFLGAAVVGLVGAGASVLFFRKTEHSEAVPEPADGATVDRTV